LQDRIEHFVRERCAGHDPAHDILHVRRVVNSARTIIAQEPGADRFITEAAAWLHDIVQIPKGSGPPGESARQSARESAAFLTQIGVDPAVVSNIAHAIEAHSFSGGITPNSVEAAIVQDADRLDALGAIGIARLWVTAGVLGSNLYEEADPAGERRQLDDRAYGLDHIIVKLLRLPDMMNTQTGRRLAHDRATLISEYRDAFLAELDGPSDKAL
jgi:uncharacterized protein